MKENPLQYRVRGTPVPTTRTRGTNYPESTRQAEGIARAKKREAYKGRAKALTAGQVEQAKRWIDEGIPKTKVAKRLGVGRTTLYEYIKVEHPTKTS